MKPIVLLALLLALAAPLVACPLSEKGTSEGAPAEEGKGKTTTTHIATPEPAKG